jgi:hypothetical protein
VGALFDPISGAAPSTLDQAVSPFDTPEEVARRRKQGQTWLNQGSSIEPVQHWTQGLARALQGAAGGYEIGQARNMERAGLMSSNAALRDVLSGKADPKAAIGTMLSNPWTSDLGREMAGRQIMTDVAQNTPQAQTALQTAQENLAQARQMHPLQLEELRTNLELLRRKDEMDQRMMDLAGFGASAGSGSQRAAVVPPADAGWQGNAAQGQTGYVAPATSTQQGAIDPGTFRDPLASKSPAQTASFRDLLASRSQAERAAFVLAYRKDPAAAAKMLEAWADPLSTQEKDRQMKYGSALGQAQADLPTALNAADRMTGQIDAVLKDKKNLSRVTGPFDAMMPTIRGGSIDMEERLKQIGGATFLQAYNALKGGGQITEVEGAKATDALARMRNLRQSDKGYREALIEFRDEVAKLRQLSIDRASGKAPPPLATTNQTRGGPPVAGAKQGRDGNWYVDDPDRPGKYLRVDQ